MVAEYCALSMSLWMRMGHLYGSLLLRIEVETVLHIELAGRVRNHRVSHVLQPG